MYFMLYCICVPLYSHRLCTVTVYWLSRCQWSWSVPGSERAVLTYCFLSQRTFAVSVQNSVLLCHHYKSLQDFSNSNQQIWIWVFPKCVVINCSNHTRQSERYWTERSNRAGENFLGCKNQALLSSYASNSPEMRHDLRLAAVSDGVDARRMEIWVKIHHVDVLSLTIITDVFMVIRHVMLHNTI